MSTPQKAYNYTYLLTGLSFLLVTGPLLRTVAPGFERPMTGFIIGLMFLAGAMTLRTAARWFRVASIMTGIAILLSVLDVAFAGPDFVVAVMFALLCFSVGMIVVVFRDVLGGGSVDLNKVIGAICIYMLFGVSWALLFVFLERIHPGSFSGLSSAGSATELSRFIYFSFVTLTTLGYGDMGPLTPIAEVFAYMEAIFGQMYLAILVASLVGIHISDRMSAAEARRADDENTPE